MASFVRDRDTPQFNEYNDPTSLSAPGPSNSRSSNSNADRGSPFEAAHNERTPSVSPRKKRRRDPGVVDGKPTESLLKRMGGPSAAKAGLGKDQEEINRIIYETSKGSRYFENERRNDERITRKVESMLATMDERLKAVPEGSHDWLAIEKKADAIRAKLEGRRDLSRHIVHCDLDMFYAAVELKRDPSLKGKAFGVGKGVLVTASYEARAFGVRSGMASYIAEALCPHLITVANDMASYVEASQQIMAIFRRFDENLDQASLDEAYLDVTDYVRLNDVSIDDAVAELRRQVREETGLTVSVGVSPNKMTSKIGSDKNKPDGQFRLEASAAAAIEFMESLPVRKVPGVGRVTERMLQALGVETCGDIWRFRARIALVLGDGSLEWLLHYHLGLGSSVVEPGKREERKSVGREHTFKPTSDPAELFELLRQSAEQVEKDLQRLDFVGRRVTLTCKLDNFQRFTRDQTQTGWVSSGDEIFRITRGLLENEMRLQPGLSLRLIGARVSTLKDVRGPKDGGPLKKMWTKAAIPPQKKNSKSRKRATLGLHGEASKFEQDDDELRSEEHEDLEEDEEARQLRLAIEASLADVRASQEQKKEGAHDPPEINVRGSVSPTEHEEAEDTWTPSPPQPRSIARFARELHRSTPESMHPLPSPKLATPTEDDIIDTAVQAEEAATAKRTNANGWLRRPGEGASAGGTEGSATSNNDLVCPICSQAVKVRFGSTLAGRNAQLNAHIDACLSGGGEDSPAPAPAPARAAAAATGSEPSKGAKKAKGGSSVGGERSGKKATLDGFFKR